MQDGVVMGDLFGRCAIVECRNHRIEGDTDIGHADHAVGVNVEREGLAFEHEAHATVLLCGMSFTNAVWSHHSSDRAVVVLEQVLLQKPIFVAGVPKRSVAKTRTYS